MPRRPASAAAFSAASALAVLLGLVLASAFPPDAAAQFVAGHKPATGRPVALAQAADTLLVTYRPSSSIAHTDTLFGAREWTPTEAGVIKLAAPGGPSQNVSVRFAGTPASGLFVLLGAGLILFGGAGYAFRKLFQDDSASAA